MMRCGWAMLVILAGAGCSRGSQQAQPPPRAAPSPAGTIPADLQGRWVLTPANCDPAKGDARGLLTIAGDGFAFGATPRMAGRVILRPGRVGFDTTDTAEGTTVSRRYEFRRSADGSQLTYARDRLPDQVYTRCPNRPSGAP